MNLRILGTAIGDLRAGKSFYDMQERGVGDYFQDCLFSEIDSLVLYGGMHRKVFDYHRMLSKRFPYAVYYRMDSADTVVVHRILDCRRDPGWLRKELE